ncbi:tyrosine-type recombinase/integrase [Mycobacterium sp.]|uniref:tyrosine-type recombinase/integrase n=1 Tax=Mycobacterium sp. TaxID=1785 RepID=UPI003F95F106
MTTAEAYRVRRTAKADPNLAGSGLFDPQINARMANELGPELCHRRHFTRSDMPDHWAGAILENQPSYMLNRESADLKFDGLPDAMATEFVWLIERQIQLGMTVHADHIRLLCRHIALVVNSKAYEHIASLVDLSRDEWMQAIRKERMRCEEPLGASRMSRLDGILGRVMALLAHAYHQGEWWQLNIWNPQFDSRIPQRVHEPHGAHVINFSRLTTPWLREAAKWWLSRNLERETYTWTTAMHRSNHLVWFQRYIDVKGCDGPHLVDDQRQLSTWVTGFREWLRKQRCATGRNKGEHLGPALRRQAMTALEQLYRFLFEEQDDAANVLGEPRWHRLGPQHSALFRLGDKPSPQRMPDPELVLSDAVISRVAEHSALLAEPREDGGFGNEQLVRILALLIKTGRRINEITMLDFDPIVAIAFPDPNGHVARLRYQQTKIVTDDHTILVDQEVVDVVRSQQDYARAFMARARKPDVDPKYLFLAELNNRNGDRPLSTATVDRTFRAFSRKIDLRDEQGKPVNIARTHTFRHTRATNLLNAGTPIHVAMRYMGHKSPVMFMHYAQTLSTVAEHEFLRYKKVTADGRDYDRDPGEMFEALALNQRTDRVLPNGYCTLPPRQACDKGNACLSCTKFVTDATFTDALQRQRIDTEQLIQKRQEAHSARFGDAMADDNIWLRGRNEEIGALDAILVSIGGVRSTDGSIVPLRGAGAPQRRTTPTTSTKQKDAT